MLKYLLLLLFLFFAVSALAQELKQGDWVIVDNIEGNCVELLPVGASPQRPTIKLKDIPCEVHVGIFLVVKEYANGQIKVECLPEDEDEGC